MDLTNKQKQKQNKTKKTIKNTTQKPKNIFKKEKQNKTNNNQFFFLIQQNK